MAIYKKFWKTLKNLLMKKIQKCKIILLKYRKIT